MRQNVHGTLNITFLENMKNTMKQSKQILYEYSWIFRGFIWFPSRKTNNIVNWQMVTSRTIYYQFSYFAPSLHCWCFSCIYSPADQSHLPSPCFCLDFWISSASFSRASAKYTKMRVKVRTISKQISVADTTRIPMNLVHQCVKHLEQNSNSVSVSILNSSGQDRWTMTLNTVRESVHLPVSVQYHGIHSVGKDSILSWTKRINIHRPLFFSVSSHFNRHRQQRHILPSTGTNLAK